MAVADDEINPKDLPALQRQLNKSLMVQWINADLVNRASNDVDKSYVYYNADYDFEFATHFHVDVEDAWAMLKERTAIRFWSKGVR